VKPTNVKTANIHASCALIGRHGVLILGESGAGKSDLLLRLMDEGGKLVANMPANEFLTSQIPAVQSYVRAVHRGTPCPAS